MKALVHVWTIFTIGILSSALAEDSTPKRLQDLKESFENAKARVIDPIRTRHIADLENLRATFLRSNRLEDAVQVDAELKSLKGIAEQEDSSASTREIPELDRLNRSHEHDVEVALTPLNARYVEELEKLKVGFAQAGDLAGTLAVDQELKQMTSASSSAEPTGEVFELLSERSFEIRGHRYLLIKGNLSYAEAEELCRRLGGHLAFIETRGEDEALQERFTEAVGVMRKNIWIGANDIAKEGEWVWGDGGRIRHEGWKSGEPNNNGEEDAAVIGRSGWWDVGVHLRNWALCEWEEWPPQLSEEINLEALKLML